MRDRRAGVMHDRSGGLCNRDGEAPAEPQPVDRWNSYATCLNEAQACWIERHTGTEHARTRGLAMAAGLDATAAERAGHACRLVDAHHHAGRLRCGALRGHNHTERDLASRVQFVKYGLEDRYHVHAVSIPNKPDRPPPTPRKAGAAAKPGQERCGADGE